MSLDGADVAHLVSVASEEIYTSGHPDAKGYPPSTR
jgi:hypothetical protein